MRVVHLSTYQDTGGAARCALALHRELRNQGVDSTLVVRSGGEREEHVTELPPVRWPLGRPWQWVNNGYLDANRTELSDTIFTSGYPARSADECDEVKSADLLHLHWVSQFLSPVTIAALVTLGKPLVWTLHDLRAFTGGCHFAAGCEGWKEHCFPCPQLREDPCRLPQRNLADQELLLGGNRFAVVTPSAWLAGLAAQSRIFRDCRIEAIPNGVDPRAFFPSSRQQARRELGLPEDGIYMVFGADSGAERRKGANELAAALDALLAAPNAPRDLRFICFGKPAARLQALGERLIPLGYLRDNAKLRAAYTAANLFVLPSLDDNLPTTMLESLACGTPVVAFASGGIPEVVRDGVTGRLAPAGDVSALTTVLAEALNRPDVLDTMGKAGAELILRDFTVEVQARRMKALYESCRPPAQTGPTPSQGSIGPYVRPAFPGLLWHATRLRLLGKH